MIIFNYFVFGLFVYILTRLSKFVFYQWRLYKQLKELPGPDIANPFTGNLKILQDIVADQKNISQKFYSKMIELSNLYGQKYGFFRLWLGPFAPWIIICDAKLARQMLTNTKFTNKTLYYRIIENFVTGNNLFTMTSLESRKERKVLKEHFTLKYIDSYISKTEVHLETFIKRLDEVVERNGGYYSKINRLVSCYVYDTVGDNLFNAHFNSVNTDEDPPYLNGLYKLVVCLETSILQPWRYALISNRILLFAVNVFNRMFFSHTIHAMKALFQYHKAVFNIVKERYNQLTSADKENWKSVDLKKPCLLDSLFLTKMLKSDNEERKENKRHFFVNLWSTISSFKDIWWQINLFIVAGHDTSTSTICWTLYMLAHHPSAQQLAAEEVTRYLDNLKEQFENGEQQKPNELNLKRLSYLECCIKESLRLHPVGPFLGRHSQADLFLPNAPSDIFIPANVDVTVFYDYAHRQEKYFPQANEFKPERFLENDLLFNSQSKTIFPFSLGERSCLGQQYAMSQMKLFFVQLLSKYEIFPIPGEKVQDKHHFLTKPPVFSVKVVKRV